MKAPITEEAQKWHDEFMGKDYVGGGRYQAFISDLKKQGFDPDAVQNISRQIRSVHLNELKEKLPPLGRIVLDEDGSTIKVENEALLKEAEPTFDRLMVGNHGVYMEFAEPANKGKRIKRRLQYTEWNRDGTKLYDQFDTVNYASYKPGKWYASIFDYDIEEIARRPTSPTARTAEAPSTINIYSTGKTGFEDLSNLALRPFKGPSGRQYYSVEHAYQSMKSGSFDETIYNNPKWEEGWTKISGRKGTRTEDNWNVQVMEHMMKASFEQNPRTMELLKRTGDSTLTHTQDKGIWKTEFPRILMKIRDEGAESITTRKNIRIPFAETSEEMAAGIKTQTARSRKLGSKGDTFKVGEDTYQLTEEPYEKSMGSIISDDYEAEGFKSPAELEQVFRNMRFTINPNRKLFVHKFKRIEGGRERSAAGGLVEQYNRIRVSNAL